MKKQVNHMPRSKEFLLGIYGCLTTGKGEHWDSFSGRRKDLFGFIDLVALHVGETWGVQVTSRAHRSDRRQKILSLPSALYWVMSGNKIFILSWEKVKNKWVPTIDEVVYDEFHELATELSGTE